MVVHWAWLGLCCWPRHQMWQVEVVVARALAGACHCLAWLGAEVAQHLEARLLVAVVVAVVVGAHRTIHPLLLQGPTIVAVAAAC